ncbi:ATP-binding protein [Lactiplantibacillus pentosus]|uniref:ATP-binding protein n=3 Tax=Lactiplantibacillus pentosus TaxID=1589 RepID=A0AAX6LE69_LACPE|nr:ATP-binding protein [Lactiplantibacillus pentosus]AYJ43093.1 ATP-binding protein [Lactiplantibacillus pentosus]KRK25371.1 aaa+ superfamily atpase [Lactiplantibacillus pentosus DSM 20314]MBU7495733.1 ATP-binding protein [Lactiplantibacillus pentosus]MCT3300982.1 ATP-binding protein [Lactiplantibacillus pentosus]MCT3313024.1 ATP-binding protein [Lactiplantibacillus pentosus]
MIKRAEYLKKLIQFRDTDLIKVITGVRRSGKSVLLMQYRDYLKSQGVADNQIIYLNFEELELLSVRTADALVKVLQPKLDKQRHQYIMLDEIQMVDGWQTVVNGIRVSYDCDIIVTGSNAKMLSGELATLLSGRYVEIPIYPFSFKEFLAAKEITSDSREVDQAFLAYEKYGGFPLVTLSPVALKDDILSSLYDTITLKDVAERAQVRDITSLRALVAFLADNIGQLVQPAKVAGVLKNEGISISNHTVENYLQLLEDAFLFYRARQYDLRGKKYLRTAGKYFIVDPGLRRTAIGWRPGNYAGQLENVVYVELQRRGYTVDVGKMNTKEIDFVARKVDRVLYVQVSYEIPANSRETDNLLQLRDNYEKLLITQRHYPDVHDVDGIPVINIVDWLLRDAPSEM